MSKLWRRYLKTAKLLLKKCKFNKDGFKNKLTNVTASIAHLREVIKILINFSKIVTARDRTFHHSVKKLMKIIMEAEYHLLARRKRSQIVVHRAVKV